MVDTGLFESVLEVRVVQNSLDSHVLRELVPQEPEDDIVRVTVSGNTKTYQDNFSEKKKNYHSVTETGR